MLREQGKPVAKRPYMSSAERARNFTLKTDINLLTEILTRKKNAFNHVPWGSPTDIPLIVVEAEIEVRRRLGLNHPLPCKPCIWQRFCLIDTRSRIFLSYAYYLQVNPIAESFGRLLGGSVHTASGWPPSLSSAATDVGFRMADTLDGYRCLY